MARRRMIDPGIWGSEDFNALSQLERLFWIGLFSNADDYGKGRAAAPYLRSTIFPFDDLTTATIEKALKRIGETMEIELYYVGDQRYYQLKEWKKWQTVGHPTASTIPDPIQEPFMNDSGTVPESSANDSGTIPPKPLRNEFKEFKEVKGPQESFLKTEGVRPSAMRPDPLDDGRRKDEIARTLADISARAGLSGGTPA